jgi:uncharacterized protein with HEPN domain
MQHDPQVLLWDAWDAAQSVVGFLEGRSRTELADNQLLRLAVERQLITLGEALSQLSREFPETAEKVPQPGAIIGFRNVLVHGYAVIDEDRVWSMATEHVPKFLEQIANLIGKVPE